MLSVFASTKWAEGLEGLGGGGVGGGVTREAQLARRS